MSYVSTAEPIKIGLLMDFKLRPTTPQSMQRRSHHSRSRIVFAEAARAEASSTGRSRSSTANPKGFRRAPLKAVIDAYGELVEEGCLLVFGPEITDNGVPTREAVEERFRVPAISVTGAEELARRVDVLAFDGLDDRRADLLGGLLARRGLARSASSSSSRWSARAT